MKHRVVNRNTLKWFYGFMLAQFTSFMFNFTQGVTASCWEEYDYRSLDKVLFKTTYAEFFKAIPYHISLGIYCLYVDFLCNVAWVFNDLFIISLSIWLERNFTIFNERILLNVNVNFIGKPSELT